MIIAYFKDGPLHDQFGALDSPKPVWEVPKPLGFSRFSAFGPDDHRAMTIEKGIYDRHDTPELVSQDGVSVWRYQWRGWQ